jgi:hypothetical protein
MENELLALQVQAFLEASEDVDVDAETIEDILEVLVDTDENIDSEMPQSQMNEDEDSHDDEDADDHPLSMSTFPAGESANETKGSPSSFRDGGQR